MKRDIAGAVFLLLLFGLFIVLSVLWPTNPLTGSGGESACRGPDCIELCTTTEDCSGTSRICCPTSWESGVCGYEQECQSIAAYSKRMSVELYQDTLRKRPTPVQGMTRFLLPILFVLLFLYWVSRKH